MQILFLLLYLFPLRELPLILEGQLRVLHNEIGIQEERRNRGQEIRKYQEATGTINRPWCTSFLVYTYNKNAQAFGLGKILPELAASQKLYGWAKRKGYLTRHPKIGDIVIFRKGNTNRGHAGAIIVVTKDSITTIEGNTTIETKKLGGVYEKKHHRRKLHKGMRIVGYINMQKIWLTTLRNTKNDYHNVLHNYSHLKSHSNTRYMGNTL